MPDLGADPGFCNGGGGLDVGAGGTLHSQKISESGGGRHWGAYPLQFQTLKMVTEYGSMLYLHTPRRRHEKPFA